MRWLLLKDLRILRRSPLLVGLLAAYPVVIAVLIGFALSRGPDKPAVAFLNQVDRAGSEISIGGESIDTSSYADRLFESVDPVRVSSRAEAIEKVRDGEVLGAIVIPPDIGQKLQSGIEPGVIDVYFNAEDPVKARYVQDTIRSQVAQANAALTQRFTKIAVGYLDLLVTGGKFSFLGRTLDVLGLERSERILRRAKQDLPRGSPERAELDRVIRFSGLARENLDLSDDVLKSVGSPIRVKSEVVEGGSTPLSSFAIAIAVTVSLMFVTLLLASGSLALEREENAFLRLVRGLVSRTGLLLEKAGLAALCSVVVCLVMLAGLGLFVGLEWSRAPLWLAALIPGGLAFAAMGVAIGALAREVRAASLLAFMISLPIAFLALVPSGAVAPLLYDIVRGISALFPFKPSLDAMDAALNDSGELLGPLLHLAVLFAAFGVAARVAMRRFA